MPSFPGKSVSRSFACRGVCVNEYTTAGSSRYGVRQGTGVDAPTSTAQIGRSCCRDHPSDLAASMQLVPAPRSLAQNICRSGDLKPQQWYLLATFDCRDNRPAPLVHACPPNRTVTFPSQTVRCIRQRQRTCRNHGPSYGHIAKSSVRGNWRAENPEKIGGLRYLSLLSLTYVNNPG